ncbi:MAG: hypothetical protein M3Y91_00850 [Actinomycetota bacterium]|nr:hypothetical protein [Actinomycetota bacterium]
MTTAVPDDEEGHSGQDHDGRYLEERADADAGRGEPSTGRRRVGAAHGCPSAAAQGGPSAAAEGAAATA